MASLTGIKKDDVIRIDVRGQRSFALVSKEAHNDPVRKIRGLTIRPMVPGRGLITSFVTAYQVVGHWRKSKATTLEI